MSYSNSPFYNSNGKVYFGGHIHDTRNSLPISSLPHQNLFVLKSGLLVHLIFNPLTTSTDEKIIFFSKSMSKALLMVFNMAVNQEN